MLKQVFIPHGEVVHVKIPVGKRCGFVQYANRLTEFVLLFLWFVVMCLIVCMRVIKVLLPCVQILCRGGVSNSAGYPDWRAECEAFLGSQPFKQTSSGWLSHINLTFRYQSNEANAFIFPASTGFQPVGWG